jgi:hypothetical protein
MVRVTRVEPDLLPVSTAERVARLDTRLFGYVESQTSEEDRRSLLALHDGVAAKSGVFSYLEIGSHLGGTLQVVIADPRCIRVASIDPRPQWTPDDRPGMPRFNYPGSSTERMLELLREVPGADLSKLETFEASTEDLPPGQFVRPDLCFIDGEHTHRATLRDARFCRAVMQGAGIIVFHDFDIIAKAIQDFLRETPHRTRGYHLSSNIFVVELGAVPTLINDPNIHRQLRFAPAVWVIANRLSAARGLIAAYAYRRQWAARRGERR